MVDPEARRQPLEHRLHSAQGQAGQQLDQAQRGCEPDDWKPMPTIGPGVQEIRVREAA